MQLLAWPSGRMPHTRVREAPLRSARPHGMWRPHTHTSLRRELLVWGHLHNCRFISTAPQTFHPKSRPLFSDACYLVLWEVTAPRPQAPSGGGSRSPTEATPQPEPTRTNPPKSHHPGQAAVCKRYAGVAPKPKRNNYTPQRASQHRAPAHTPTPNPPGPTACDSL